MHPLTLDSFIKITGMLQTKNTMNFETKNANIKAVCRICLPKAERNEQPFLISVEAEISI